MTKPDPPTIHSKDFSAHNWFQQKEFESFWNQTNFLQQASRKNDDSGFSEDLGSGVRGWHNTIILHPGSRNLIVGTAQDAYPKIIPHCIAHLQKQDNIVQGSYGFEGFNSITAKLFTGEDIPIPGIPGTPDSKMDVDTPDESNRPNTPMETVEPNDPITSQPSIQPPVEIAPLKTSILPTKIPEEYTKPLDPHLHPCLLQKFAGMVHGMHNDLRGRLMFPGEKDKKDKKSKNRKRRELQEAVAQVTQTCSNFNTGDGKFGEIVSEMNDRERIEWTEVVKPAQPIKGFGSGGLGVLPNSPPLISCAKPWYIGEEALNIPSFSTPPTSPDYPKFSLLYPIRHGQPNCVHYASLQHVKDDLERIWEYALKKVVDKKDWNKRNVILVLPDHATPGYIQIAASILLSSFGFKNLSIVSESIAAILATGWNGGTVVDIGAHTTTVAIVEDGIIHPDSMVSELVGGDFVNHYLSHMLHKLDFPVVFTPSLSHWNLLERLKQRFVTLFIPDMQSQSGKLWQPGLVTHRTISFEVRYPGDKGTLAYRAKTSDEFWIAGLAYFYPGGMFQLHRLLGYYNMMVENMNPEMVKGFDTLDKQEQDVLLARFKRGFLNFVWGSNPIMPNFIPKEKSVELSILDEPLKGYPPTEDKSKEKQREKEEADLKAWKENPNQKVVEKKVDKVDKTLEKFTEKLSHIVQPKALDVLIAQSLHSYHESLKRTHPATADDRLRRMAQSILLTGGGSMIPGLVDVLGWRVGEKLNPHLTLSPDKTGQPPAWVQTSCHLPPRDMDSRMVMFKGASVLSRLEGQDYWVNRQEFELAGAARCCQLRWGIPWI